MESERSSKRRKLDTPQGTAPKSTPPSQQARKLATYSSKKPGFQIRAEPTAKSKPVPKSGHQAWAETKAKGFGIHPSEKGKKAEAALYDDIDGAHSSPQRKAVSTGKRKAQLDPLRNQRVESLSSPVRKVPLKAAAGFFKQYHAPKPDTRPATPKSNGVSSRHATPASVSSEEKDDAGGSEEYESVGSSTKGDKISQKPGKQDGHESGAMSGQPTRKKTFEDEVKELEAAAREEVKREKQQDAAGASSAKRRSSGRPKKDAITPIVKATPKRLAQKATESAQVARFGSPSPVERDGTTQETMSEPPSQQPKPQVAQRRKANRVDHIDSLVEPEQPDVDAMDVDYEAEEQEPLVEHHSRTQPPAKQPATPSKTKSRPQSASTSMKGARDFAFEPEHLTAIQSILLEQLTGKRPTPLTNLTDEYTKVSSLITQTITAGESNSMLLIGARGSGKTALVNQILREQTLEHPDDFHTVRLSGFIHTDDKIALREIWRQLGREMEIEDDVGSSGRNYADTLTTLLALLSHPAEQGREQEAGQVTKSVVFILDEFELFATHPRQTLLYNLFDIAQSRKAPIAVLGLTTKIDVSENLEKRVKSRFSHRYVHLSLPKSFAAYREGCKAAACINGDVLSEEERKQLGMSGEAWDGMMDALLSADALANHLRRLNYTTKSIPDFTSSMLLPIATLSVDGKVSATDLLEHFTTNIVHASPPDSKLTILPSLSTLHLALLICAARLTNIYNTDLVSFALAYEEYKVLASKAKLQSGAGVRVSGRAVAKGAWEDLASFALVVEDGRGGSGRVDVGLKEIGACAGQMGLDLGGWGRWCREI